MIGTLRILSDQKGFVPHLLLIVFLLISIPIGLYLVFHPQIFNPKAYNADLAVERENPQNVQQTLDFLETNISKTEDNNLRGSLDTAAMEELAVKVAYNSYRDSSLAEKINRLRNIFKIPLIVPDDQVENYARMKLADVGITVEGSLLEEYSVTISEDCYSPFDPATGTSLPPICSLNIDEFSKYGDEILDILVGDFVDLYKSLKEVTNLKAELEELMLNAGIIVRTTLDPNTLYKKYRNESLYQGEGNNAWGKAIKEILDKDISEKPDDLLPSNEVEQRRQLSEKLNLYLQKSIKFDSDVQMAVFLNTFPQEKLVSFLARTASPIYKPLANYFKRTVKPLLEETRASIARVFEGWFVKKIDLNSIQNLINEKNYTTKISVVDIPRPISGNTIDVVQAEEWIDAHPTPETQKAARAIINSIRHISQEEFEEKLKKTLDIFNNSLGTEKYALLVESKKSSYWVSQLALPNLKFLPEQIYSFDNSGDSVDGNIRRFLYIDDASYTGTHVEEYMRAVANLIEKHNIPASEVELDVVLPFISDKAKNTIAELQKQYGFKIQVFSNDKIELMTEKITDKQVLDTIRRMYGHVFHDFSEESINNLFNNMSLTYFDHKIPDEVTTLESALRYGNVYDGVSKSPIDQVSFIPETIPPYK